MWTQISTMYFFYLKCIHWTKWRKKPSECSFTNAKHGKGSVSHQWNLHFQMHLLGTNLGFQRKMTPDKRDVLSLGSNRKVGQKLNIQASNVTGATLGRGSCTLAAASSSDIQSSGQWERLAHRTTQIKTFISFFTFISRSVLWAKNETNRQTVRQTLSSLWIPFHMLTRVSGAVSCVWPRVLAALILP